MKPRGRHVPEILVKSMAHARLAGVVDA